jgi:hypothetical protein
VLCLIVVPLPPGEHPFAVKINNKFHVEIVVSNHKISYVIEQVSVAVMLYIFGKCSFGICGD